jgi:hypothetical protein
MSLEQANAFRTFVNEIEAVQEQIRGELPAMRVSVW